MPFALIAQQRQQMSYDSNRQDAHFSVGDLERVWKPDRKVRLPEKLLRRYFGPYKFVR